MESPEKFEECWRPIRYIVVTCDCAPIHNSLAARQTSESFISLFTADASLRVALATDPKTALTACEVTLKDVEHELVERLRPLLAPPPADALLQRLLADDHPALRAGLRAILEKAPDVQVIREAEDGTEAQRLTASQRPQVLLLDEALPGPRPAETVAWVRAHCPETAVLVLTAHDVDGYLAAMVEAGAVGFVVKEEAPETIVEAVRRAARGGVFFSGEQRARARVRRWREEVGVRWESLTECEREVLRLLVEGLDNAAIAERLCMTIRTVECHVTSILSKLGVASRLEAVAWIHKHLADDLWKSTG